MPYELQSFDINTPVGEAINRFVNHEKKKSIIIGTTYGFLCGLITGIIICKKNIIF